jgi:hypothetical protein
MIHGRVTGALAALGISVVLVACGGGSSEERAPEPQPQPTARAEEFPSADGRSLQEVIQGMEQGLELAPSVSVLDKGVNRYGFVLIDGARELVNDAPVAVYVARGDGSGARGPFVARSESLRVRPQFESRQTAADIDVVNSVYVADVRIRRNGTHTLLAVTKLDGRLVATTTHQVKVGQEPEPPRPGERAPRIKTLTGADVGGDLSKISTRLPPAEELLRDDFADVVGRKPVVITFATPQFCQARVCGPVVDIVAQVQARYGDRVSFIHQEVFEDNDPKKGLRPQLVSFRLQSEPWTFVIDRDGRVSTRFEGAFSVGELERAVAKVAGPS